jgi:uncharacterized protein
MTQLTVLSGIAIVMTAGVYGLVAGIVKLDDGGLYLSRRAGASALRGIQRGLGRGILRAAPWMMKGLSIAGTLAMFLVGGGILTHGFAALGHGIEALAERLGDMDHAAAQLLAAVTPMALNAVIGLVAGAVVLLTISTAKRMFARG